MLPTNNILRIRLFTAFFSLLLSTIAFYTDDIINRDAIIYFGMAETYLENGLAATAQYSDLYWPFFSILIAHLHTLTSLTIEISADILNIAFFVLLTDALVLISSKTLPNTRQVAIAALLFLCFQTLNEYRDFIVRDIGYWALCGFALYQFILFIEKPSLSKAMLWQAIVIVAILFRIEGLVTLLALPLYLFFTQPIKQALKQCSQLYSLFFIGTISALFFTVGQSDFLTAFGKITTLSKYINPDSFFTALNSKSAIIATHVLHPVSAKYSSFVLISGLVFMMFYKIIKAVSFGYIALYLINWKQKSPSHSYRYLLAYFTLLNLSVLLVFLFHGYFITTRYALMAILGILLLMLPVLCSNIEQAWLNRKKLTLTFIGFVLLVSLVGSMTQTSSKAFIKETALWAADNLPAESRVLTDEKLLEYYFSTHTSDSIAMLEFKESLTTYSQYDYLLIVEKKRDKQLKLELSTMPINLIYNQSNKKGNQASVYETHP